MKIYKEYSKNQKQEQHEIKTEEYHSECFEDEDGVRFRSCKSTAVRKNIEY